MNWLHKRCDDEILYLRGQLDEAQRRIVLLENELLASANRPTIPVGGPRSGDVYYMDDARLVELEEHGTAPT